MIKTRVVEDGVPAARMDGKSMDVEEEDEVKARVEKELFLPSGWMASPWRCRWRT